VHQPWRLRRYSVFDTHGDYFDEYRNRAICRKVAEKCYLPVASLLRELLDEHSDAFRLAFSITGTVLDQFEQYAPEVLDSFQSLAQSDNVELMAETDYHTLASEYAPDEFQLQIARHMARTERLFGKRPVMFRNTELIYHNALADRIRTLGFRGVLCEGVDDVLAGRDPGHVYKSPTASLPLLLRHYRLSDDIAFRFSDRGWTGWPLTPKKFVDRLTEQAGSGDCVVLGMDFETFGEHQWADTGILEFLRKLPGTILQASSFQFATPNELVENLAPVDVYDTAEPTSWADTSRDLSAWVGNSMQQNAVRELYRLGPEIKATGDSVLLEDWRRLQSSDHLYYMCTKYYADGSVHKYFSPYESPYDAYINYMNVLDNLRLRAERARRESDYEPG
jgi:alpha-amylase